MLQNLLVLLAPARDLRGTLPPAARLHIPMATKSHTHLERKCPYPFSAFMAVVGNCLGLMLFFAGLFLVLRLGEVLLT